jgi:hypothetical protein
MGVDNAELSPDLINPGSGPRVQYVKSIPKFWGLGYA